MRSKLVVLALSVLSSLALVSVAAATNGHDESDGHKVTICHATGSGKYVKITPSVNSLKNGHGTSGINAGDIVPPTPGTDFPHGQNWTATGILIWLAGCKTYHPPVVVPPVTVPPVVLAPPVAQRNTILFCVQTSNRGWSTVEAESDAFNAPNGVWYKLFVSKASVLVAGHVLNLTGLEAWEPGNGVVIANSGTGCDGRAPYAGVPVIK